MSDQTEELILALERAYFPLPSLCDPDHGRRAISNSALWASFGQGSPPTNTTFSGSVDGCATGVAGIAVEVVDHATSALLDTVTTDGSGNFSGSLTLSGSLSVDFIASGTNWTTTTLTRRSPAGRRTRSGRSRSRRRRATSASRAATSR